MDYTLDEIKIILREEAVPFFTDDEIAFYLTKNDTQKKALYEMLLVKAENTTVQMSGLSLADTSKYFRRLANQYRPTNSGILKGGF